MIMTNKKCFYLKGVLFLLLLCNLNNIYAQIKDTLVIESVYDNADINIVPTSTAKMQRMSSKRGGKIIYDVPSEMPDSLQVAVKVAKEIWESYIDDTMNVDIRYVDLDDIDIRVEVDYSLYSNDNVYYPDCLYCRLFSVSNDKYDGIIEINNKTNWRVGIGDYNVPNTKNLSYVMLQSFAAVLGFSSSVQPNRRGDLAFKFIRSMSVFDRLLFSNGGERMEDIPITSSTAIGNLVQQDSGYLYILKADEKYKLYAPKIYDRNRSLRYMLAPDCLMHYDEIGNSTNKDLVVDDVTIDILNAIGWDISNKNFRIIGRDIDETGIASAYTSHSFYIQSTGMNITNHNWEYKLPLKTGGYSTIMTSSSAEFIIQPITNENIYEHTLEGDIKGIITFTGISNGEEIKDVYNITLELKPHILSAEVVSIIQSDRYDDYYNAIIDIYYEGCHYLHASVEEEYSSSMNTYYSDRPFYTRLKINDIDGYGYAWINIIVRNEYGSDEVIIEIPYQDFTTRSTTEVNIVNEKRYSKIDVFSIDGKYITSIISLNELSKYNDNVLILKLYNDNGYIKTVKYIK